MAGQLSLSGRCGVRTSGVLQCWVLALLLGVTRVCAQSLPLLAEPIPPQPLSEALAKYAELTGLQIIYFSDVARGQTSKGTPVGLAPTAALTRLLDGTGLRCEFLNARTVRLLPIDRKSVV